MPSYPSPADVPRRSSVTPINPPPSDLADGGGVRVASLAAIQAYRVDLTHPMITADQLDVLLGAFSAYQNQQVSIVRADSMVYVAPWVDEPEYEEVSGSRYTAKSRLTGRRIASYVPAGYGHFETSPTVTISAGAATASYDTAIKRFGERSLKITKNSTDAVATSVHLAATATTYNATIPANTKWLLIASLRMSVARSLGFSIRLSDASYITGGSSYTPPATATWYRVARILDATAAGQTTAHIRFSWSSAAASGETLNLDGMSLIPLTGIDTEVTESAFPSIYLPPEP